MKDKNAKWVRGDGGPLVILQQEAALRWKGTSDFDNSPTRKGNTETDYDVMCRCPDGINVIERYARDMLVLSDSKWAACFIPSSVAEVVVIQWFGSDCNPGEMISRLMAAPPAKTLHFTMIDTTLRLMVGTDDGKARLYDFAETKVFPGEKICDVFYSEEAQLAVLRPADAAVSS